jgi:hypothetical protein
MRAKTNLSKVATECESIAPKGNRYPNRISAANTDYASHTKENEFIVDYNEKSTRQVLIESCSILQEILQFEE